MKVKISLTPYNALTILGFLTEFKEDIEAMGEKGTALKLAVDEFESELSLKMTDEMLLDGDAENQVNQLIGKSPIRE